MEILLLVLLGATSIYMMAKNYKQTWNFPNEQTPTKWVNILSHKVPYYNALNPKEKKLFGFKVQEFLLNYMITGVDVEVDVEDRLLVAAGAVIPIFKFPNFRYTNLNEVILYPGSFNFDFKRTGPDRNILGMVGTGVMEGKMILSKKALHHGFDVDNDKRNTAIHEFIHLLDKVDGAVDGIPKILLERPYVMPWINLIHEKMEEIYAKDSDINRYGGTSKIEFFAVACEYFFEQPKLMASKHPELYDVLERVFNQDMDARDLKRERVKIGRNSPCPCQSGEKFKRCCGV